LITTFRCDHLTCGWAIGSPGRELLLLINLIGTWLIFYGVGEIFAAFALRSRET
jgi:hypothetical protein